MILILTPNNDFTVYPIRAKYVGAQKPLTYFSIPIHKPSELVKLSSLGSTGVNETWAKTRICYAHHNKLPNFCQLTISCCLYPTNPLHLTFPHYCIFPHYLPMIPPPPPRAFLNQYLLENPSPQVLFFSFENVRRGGWGGTAGFGRVTSFGNFV